MDVWVSTVAVYGILFGAVAVWWLVRRKTRAVVERDAVFWGKHVGLPFSSLHRTHYPFSRTRNIVDW